MKDLIKKEVDNLFSTGAMSEYYEEMNKVRLNLVNEIDNNLDLDIDNLLNQNRPKFIFLHEVYMRKKIRTIKNILVFFCIIAILNIVAQFFGGIYAIVSAI